MVDYMELDPAAPTPLSSQRDAARIMAWSEEPSTSNSPPPTLQKTLLAEAHAAARGARSVGTTLDQTLEILRQQQERREAAMSAAQKERAAAEAKAREEAAKAAAAAAAAAEAQRAADAKKAADAAEAQRKKQEADAARLQAEQQKQQQQQASTAAAAATVAAPSTAPTPAAAKPAVGSAGTDGFAKSTPESLHAEWEAARSAVERDAAVNKRAGGAGGRKVTMLVSQVARVHSVVWEKAMDVLDNMNGMKQAAGSDAQAVDAARVAGCFAVGKRLIGQGEMLVDKQPGMAYALAGLALHVGESEPGVWTTLEEQLIERCCYIVPHYVRRPASGDANEWKGLLGYAKKGMGRRGRASRSASTAQQGTSKHKHSSNAAATQQPRSHTAATQPRSSHAATQQPRSHEVKQCSHSHALPSPLSLSTHNTGLLRADGRLRHPLRCAVTAVHLRALPAAVRGDDTTLRDKPVGHARRVAMARAALKSEAAEDLGDDPTGLSEAVEPRAKPRVPAAVLEAVEAD